MSEATFECRDLAKSFGGFRAVDRVSIPFEAGRITALVGPNGAGKTTLFHLFTGALRPDSGDVLYRGRSVTGLPPWARSRLGIGRLFQDVRVFGRLTALENVLVAFQGQAGEAPLSALFARLSVRRQEAARRAEALNWLAEVDLVDFRDSPAEALSYGQQKLLAIARMLAVGSDILLLDEPTAGVHPVLIDHLIQLIRRLAREGRTIIMIEHNMAVVLEAADWVFFMDEGQIVESGLPREVLEDPTVRAVYLGLSPGELSAAEVEPGNGVSSHS